MTCERGMGGRQRRTPTHRDEAAMNGAQLSFGGQMDSLWIREPEFHSPSEEVAGDGYCDRPLIAMRPR
jgi:hypothetical protein